MCARLATAISFLDPRGKTSLAVLPEQTVCGIPNTATPATPRSQVLNDCWVGTAIHLLGKVASPDMITCPHTKLLFEVYQAVCAPCPSLMVMLVLLARRLSDNPTTADSHDPSFLINNFINDMGSQFEFDDTTKMLWSCICPRQPPGPDRVRVRQLLVCVTDSTIEQVFADHLSPVELPDPTSTCQCGGTPALAACYANSPVFVVINFLPLAVEGKGMDGRPRLLLSPDKLPTSITSKELGFSCHDTDTEEYVFQSAAVHMPSSNHYVTVLRSVGDVIEPPAKKQRTGSSKRPTTQVGVTNAVIMDDRLIRGLVANEKWRANNAHGSSSGQPSPKSVWFTRGGVTFAIYKKKS